MRLLSPDLRVMSINGWPQMHSSQIQLLHLPAGLAWVVHLPSLTLAFLISNSGDNNHAQCCLREVVSVWTIEHYPPRA